MRLGTRSHCLATAMDRVWELVAVASVPAAVVAAVATSTVDSCQCSCKPVRSALRKDRQTTVQVKKENMIKKQNVFWAQLTMFMQPVGHVGLCGQTFESTLLHEPRPK